MHSVLLDRYEGSICFEDIVTAIEGGGVLDDVAHPNQGDYAHQRMFVVLCNDYVYAVPYVEGSNGVFLKTALPSRRLKAIYWPGDGDE